MKLTTLDPLGAFYLVALDADGNLRPQNVNANGTFGVRSTITMPIAYPVNVQPGRIETYTVAYKKFEQQQYIKADLLFAPASEPSDQFLTSIRHWLSVPFEPCGGTQSYVWQHHQA
jgi:hypothetical protein